METNVEPRIRVRMLVFLASSGPLAGRGGFRRKRSPSISSFCDKSVQLGFGQGRRQAGDVKLRVTGCLASPRKSFLALAGLGAGVSDGDHYEAKDNHKRASPFTFCVEQSQRSSYTRKININMKIYRSQHLFTPLEIL